MIPIPKLGPVIAIDGPAGTGKSSTTRKLAEELGFVHIDTGALYRAVALSAIDQELIDPVSARCLRPDAIAELARTIHLEFKRVERLEPANRIFSNGKDVTELIRAPEISRGASAVSAIPEVRAALLGLQRRLGCAGRTILEGRDIGTVIFPDADVKFFLTASPEVRAKRRLLELEQAGALRSSLSLDEVKKEILARDHADSTRAIAPLKKASDAVEVDTSHLSFEEVIDLMVKIAHERLSK